MTSHVISPVSSFFTGSIVGPQMQSSLVSCSMKSAAMNLGWVVGLTRRDLRLDQRTKTTKRHNLDEFSINADVKRLVFDDTILV